MRETLISSAVLILALTALRFLFRKRISRRLQYALWGLVLLRLALPVPLPEARFSVMTGAERLSGQVEAARTAPAASPAPGGRGPGGGGGGARAGGGARGGVGGGGAGGGG